MSFFGKLGRKIILKLDYYGGVLSLSLFGLLQILKRRKKGQRKVFYQMTIKQIFFTAYQALPNVIMISLILGIGIIFIFSSQLSGIISEEQISNLIIKIFIRELIPVISGIIVIARSCSAIAVEIATITVNKEFDLLVSMGIDPLYFIVLPRILGMIISLVILISISTFTILILSAILSGIIWNIQAIALIGNLFSELSEKDLFLLLTKGLMCGLVMPSLSCYHGFKAINQNFIPIAATKAIISCLFYLMVINFIITGFFYASI